MTSRALIALIHWPTACSLLTGALLALFRPEAPANISNRTLTFAERVAYQRAASPDGVAGLSPAPASLFAAGPPAPKENGISATRHVRFSRGSVDRGVR
jgi:hypothetical protein